MIVTPAVRAAATTSLVFASIPVLSMTSDTAPCSTPPSVVKSFWNSIRTRAVVLGSIAIGTPRDADGSYGHANRARLRGQGSARLGPVEVDAGSLVGATSSRGSAGGQGAGRLVLGAGGVRPLELEPLRMAQREADRARRRAGGARGRAGSGEVQVVGPAVPDDPSPGAARLDHLHASFGGARGEIDPHDPDGR